MYLSYCKSKLAYLMPKCSSSLGDVLFTFPCQSSRGASGRLRCRSFAKHAPLFLPARSFADFDVPHICLAYSLHALCIVMEGVLGAFTFLSTLSDVTSSMDVSSIFATLSNHPVLSSSISLVVGAYTWISHRYKVRQFLF